jgi:biopolymer transport protein ExbB
LRIIVENGGLTVVFIGLTSVVAVTLVVERCWRLLPLRRRFAEVRGACNEALLRAGPAEALALLQRDDPMTRVLRAGLLEHARDATLVRIAATNAAQREVEGIERGLGVIQIAAQIAPWLGLLGTVAGLMDVFQQAGATAVLTNAQVSGGIYKALGTTVAGLILAILTYIAYGLLTGLSNRLIDQLENAAADLPVYLRSKI